MICPISYKECGKEMYAVEGLHKISSKLQRLGKLSLTADEQVKACVQHSASFAIPGEQPKLNAKLNLAQSCFEITDTFGQYILKPQQMLFPELPENENVTMKMAELAGIEVPLNGLLYSKDGTMTYFIKRFDRDTHQKRLPMEDFLQLSAGSQKTKYDSTMEHVAHIIDQYCTFPIPEKQKLFRRLLFCFLIGNEDMHLKNFCLTWRGNRVLLSPAFDLVNTTLVERTNAEIGLPLNGKKKDLQRSDFELFAKQTLGLNIKVINQEFEYLKNCKNQFDKLISISFLSDMSKMAYSQIVDARYFTIYK